MADRVQAAQYVRDLQLHTLHLSRATHERGKGALTEETDLISEGSVDIATDAEGARVLFLVSVKYRIAEPEATLEQYAAFGEVTFAVVYDVLNNAELSEDQLEEFAYAATIFQAHPYIREHIASMCLRSGLPAYHLPLLIHDPAARDS